MKNICWIDNDNFHFQGIKSKKLLIEEQLIYNWRVYVSSTILSNILIGIINDEVNLENAKLKTTNSWLFNCKETL
jgi:hypothetical protein